MAATESQPQPLTTEIEPQIVLDKATVTVVEVGDRVGRLSIEIADVAGLVSDLTTLAGSQMDERRAL